MTVLLEIGPLTARDGEGRVLFADATLRLTEAEATLLGGPSGSGKSTLLRNIAGLEQGDQPADRLLNGERYSGLGIPRWRSHVTLLSQEAPMLPGTVLHNLGFCYGFKFSAGRVFDEAEARKMMERTGLGGLPMDRDITTLSGGERHRLALARGLLWDPPILLADEPVSGLDADSAERCLDLLLAFARRTGHALLLVLHDAALAHRVDGGYRLDDGRLEKI
jgi:ABC-type iron transport system FetAB ATPase subunit